MLVLNRQTGQKIIINEGPDEIEVVVVEIRGDKVRLGIKAPRDVPVDREEVREAIKKYGRKKLPDYLKCPKCGGPTEFSRSLPPEPYLCAKCDPIRA